MCIVFIAYKAHKDYPLIVAANRDEFHQRKTLVAEFWENYPTLLAGKDQEAGGTWMGVTTAGRFCALTNIRNATLNVDNAHSRGALPLSWLTTTATADMFSSQLSSTSHKYNGFNIFYGHVNALFFYNSAEKISRPLSPGVHGLSNATLNTPWPKVELGRETLRKLIHDTKPFQKEDLFTLLNDAVQADVEYLPNTGIGVEWEKQLSSIFINTPQYGTRSSTLLMQHKNGEVFWEERTYNNKGTKINQQSFNFLNSAYN